LHILHCLMHILHIQHALNFSIWYISCYLCWDFVVLLNSDSQTASCRNFVWFCLFVSDTQRWRDEIWACFCMVLVDCCLLLLIIVGVCGIPEIAGPKMPWTSNFALVTLSAFVRVESP
jgi:hypothetical protein